MREIFQLRGMQETLHSLGHAIEKLNLNVEREVSLKHSRGLTSVVEVSDMSASGKEKVGNSGESNHLQNSVPCSQLDQSLACQSDMNHLHVPPSNLPKNERLLLKNIGRGQSKITHRTQNSLSQSGDISFFDSSVDISAAVDSARMGSLIEEEDENENEGDNSRSQSNPIIRKHAAGSNENIGSVGAPESDAGGKIKQELKSLLLMFKDVDGDAEAMDEYLQLVREMSEHFVDNSFE